MSVDQNSLSLGILVGGLALVYYTNNKDYAPSEGPALPFKFSREGDYAHMSPMKHDMFKQATLNIFPFLVLGIILGQSQGPLFSTEDFFGSLVGRTLLEVAAYATYYQIVEPYMANATPIF
jgi:hypothetical protein